MAGTHQGHNVLECRIPGGLLNAGTYLVHPRLALYGIRFIVHADAVVSFETHMTHSVSPYSHHTRPGVVIPLLEWRKGEEGGP